jgi:hypothetical protein
LEILTDFKVEKKRKKNGQWHWNRRTENIFHLYSDASVRTVQVNHELYIIARERKFFEMRRKKIEKNNFLY